MAAHGSGARLRRAAERGASTWGGGAVAAEVEVADRRAEVEAAAEVEAEDRRHGAYMVETFGIG